MRPTPRADLLSDDAVAGLAASLRAFPSRQVAIVTVLGDPFTREGRPLAAGLATALEHAGWNPHVTGVVQTKRERGTAVLTSGPDVAGDVVAAWLNGLGIACQRRQDIGGDHDLQIIVGRPAMSSWQVRRLPAEGATVRYVPARPADGPPPSSSDPVARDRLVARIGDINDDSRPRPLMSLEEFFEGNDDWGSIGYNLPHNPGPAAIYAWCRTLRDRPEVDDVVIEVKDLEEVDGWPSSDTIWVITTASERDVVAWCPPELKPDEWGAVSRLGPPDTETQPMGAQRHAVFLFYD